MQGSQDAARSSSSTRRLLAALSALCLLAVGAALVAQYAFDMRPCPWCVLQRGVYLLMALALGLSAALHRRAGPAWKILAALGLSLAAAGIASALYQHLVAAQQFSCSRTLADKIVAATQLDALLPAVFSATASCAEAAVSVLGIPFAYWSLGLYLILAAGSVWALLRPSTGR